MMQNVIFDLDGTLLDTLKDIQDAINDALRAGGFPYRYSRGECRLLIGNGADSLMHRALKDYDNEDNFLRLKKEYMPRYRDYQNRHTKPFDGIKAVLKELRGDGISLFVCTNKPDALAQSIVRSAFGEKLFMGIRGLKEGEEPKPNPAIANHFIETHGLNRHETIFVGDSVTDLLTARAAALPVAIALWGYGRYDEDWLKDAEIILKEPKEILRIRDYAAF